MAYLTIHKKEQFLEGKFGVIKENINIKDADLPTLKMLYPEDRYHYEFHINKIPVNYHTGFRGIEKY